MTQTSLKHDRSVRVFAGQLESAHGGCSGFENAKAFSISSQEPSAGRFGAQQTAL